MTHSFMLFTHLRDPDIQFNHVALVVKLCCSGFYIATSPLANRIHKEHEQTFTYDQFEQTGPSDFNHALGVINKQLR